MLKIPVIIDTDPGIDDFFALVVAAASDMLDVRAITPVAGNQTYEKVYKNAADIRDLLGLQNARLPIGAKRPLVIEQETAGNVHGENGLGGIKLAPAVTPGENAYAWDVIYDEAKKADGRLQIAALGPLTNIATAILKYPDLPAMIDKLYIMGGSDRVGNHSPYGEFNIWVDPHAADIVFTSGIKTIKMIGLNLTHQAAFSVEEYHRVLETAKGGKLEKIAYDLIDFLNEVCKKFGSPSMTMHDAIVVAAMLDEELIDFYPSYVRVEYQSKIAKGQTVVFAKNGNRVLDKGNDNAVVAETLHTDRYKKILADSFRKFC